MHITNHTSSKEQAVQLETTFLLLHLLIPFLLAVPHVLILLFWLISPASLALVLSNLILAASLCFMFLVLAVLLLLLALAILLILLLPVAFCITFLVFLVVCTFFLAFLVLRRRRSNDKLCVCVYTYMYVNVHVIRSTSWGNPSRISFERLVSMCICVFRFLYLYIYNVYIYTCM